MNYLEAILIAIVQGITEFLPVSSTGHMIIVETLLGIPPDNKFVAAFTVCIQLGSILSVLILYWRRFLQSVNFYVKLFIAFIPAAILGFLLNNIIEQYFLRIEVVAASLLVGGIVLVFVDRWFKGNTDETKEVKYMSAFKIGLFQVLAMIPGVSRSAATIVGGLTQKLTRKNAAEFSFFLAVPTMFAATAYKLFKIYDTIEKSQIKILVVGNVVAFVVAIIAIKAFITFLTRYGFKLFGYYRIVLGIVLLILFALGVDLNISG
ncbi:MAG: undecaprenyl-diphosphate phosphatase [Bacteroidota bacterium]